jgi:hypothetical protein
MMEFPISRNYGWYKESFAMDTFMTHRTQLSLIKERPLTMARSWHVAAIRELEHQVKHLHFEIPYRQSGNTFVPAYFEASKASHGH